MPGPQRSDVQETDPRHRDEDIAYVVGVMMVALITFHALNCLILPVCLVTELPIPTIGLPCAVLATALCIKKLIRAASRTGANGDSENGGTAQVVEASDHDRASVGSDGAGEHGMVRPPVVTIPSSSSSSRSGSGVVVTAADVELGGASHHRRGERRGGAHDTSGDPIGDTKGKNA